MATSTVLGIRGYGGAIVPNRFQHSDNAIDCLALLLPGLGYTLDMPLFYYAEYLLLERGWDVLRVECAYNRLPQDETTPWTKLEQRLYEDAAAVWRAGLGHREYERVALIGKSLGTLAMGHLLTMETPPIPVGAIWLTPILSVERLREQIAAFGGPSLVVIGTADEEYDPGTMNAMVAATSGDAVVVEGADHGMDIPGDSVASVSALEQVVTALGRFL